MKKQKNINEDKEQNGRFFVKIEKKENIDEDKEKWKILEFVKMEKRVGY